MIRFLRSSYAILIVIALALHSQMAHASYVFAHLEAKIDGAQSRGDTYAIALESAVLIFIVNGCMVESYAFALAGIFMNLAYYAILGIPLFSAQALPAWLIAIILPAAIARYSHLIANRPALSGFEESIALWVNLRYRSLRVAIAKRIADWRTPALPQIAPAQIEPTTIVPAIDTAPAEEPVDERLALKQRIQALRDEAKPDSEIAKLLDIHPNKLRAVMRASA